MVAGTVGYQHGSKDSSSSRVPAIAGRAATARTSATGKTLAALGIPAIAGAPAAVRLPAIGWKPDSQYNTSASSTRKKTMAALGMLA
jgi:hypothetical protein